MNKLADILYILIMVSLFILVLLIFDITSCSFNVNQTKNNPPQIEQRELKIHSLDTINLDNPHISIVTIDSVRFLLVHNGKNFDIERFDKWT